MMLARVYNAGMKLYYLTGACSLATYISLLEAGQKFEAFSVDRATKQTSDGKDYNTINPKGYVPALVLDNGEMLTENVAVLSYVASLDKSGKLAPTPGTLPFYRVVEWLSYVNGEVHKNFGPLFRPNLTEEAKTAAKEMIAKRLGLIEQRLTGSFLTGENFTVADAYLFVVLSWRTRVGVDISAFPKLTAFFERVRTRPTVQQAFTEEGLTI
jgi:glutathione S-transferase